MKEKSTVFTNFEQFFWQHSRSEESVISIEYLRELHDLHEKWLMDGEDEVPAPVLVVDADQDINLTPDMFSQTEENIFDSFARK